MGFHATIQLENATKSVALGEDKNLCLVGHSGLFFSLRKLLLGAAHRDLGPGRDTCLPGWKTAVTQSSPQHAAGHLGCHWWSWNFRAGVLQKLEAEQQSAFRKNTYRGYSWCCQLSKICCRACAACQKANSGSMQTTNTLNPTAYFVSEAERGAFALRLGDLASTNSNGCEEHS